MRVLLSCAAAIAMILLGWNVDASAATRKKTAKKTAAASSRSRKKAGTTARKSGTRRKGATAGAKASSSKSKSKSSKSAGTRRVKAAPRTTWRNRQLSPTPDRYKEIQEALAAKGFLKPEDATGEWNSTSIAALKKFQANQNLEASGKINSLSLIALGLGPRREAAAAVPPSPQPNSPAQPDASPQLNQPAPAASSSQPGQPSQPNPPAQP